VTADLTLIIDHRIREGAENIGAIPVTQNGFQGHLRTNDNVFVLLSVIDTVESEDVPFYVAYLDLKNAFLHTDRPTLWVKLAMLGISGPLIEWLKCLYERICYIVHLEGHFAPMFKSLLGMLTGESAIQDLWNLFMADFILDPHPSDIKLNGASINQIAHADDVFTASTSPSGFQLHLNGSQRLADDNGCQTSIPKCLYQSFGRRPKPSEYPSFHLNGKTIHEWTRPATSASGLRLERNLYGGSNTRSKQRRLGRPPMSFWVSIALSAT
jgi:hypothetical protein